MDDILGLIKEKNIFVNKRFGLPIVSLNNQKAIELTKQILYKIVNQKTVLFLSGGTTPKPLYEELATDRKINPGAAAMIDERFGNPFHPNSNEKMIEDTGFLYYLKLKNIPFYSVLQKESIREEVARDYDETVRYLFNFFPKSIGILGFGSDGHTAGIAPNRKDFTNPVFEKSKDHLFVSDFNDHQGSFGERITLTFKGLSMLDILIVVFFGKNKKKALKEILKQGSLQEIPARFYLSQDLAKKTLFITDQKI